MQQLRKLSVSDGLCRDGEGTDMWRPDYKYLGNISLPLQTEMSAQRSFPRTFARHGRALTGESPECA